MSDLKLHLNDDGVLITGDYRPLAFQRAAPAVQPDAA